MDRAAQWGWDQRGTINEAQLQERADQELKACLELLFRLQDALLQLDTLNADLAMHGRGCDLSQIRRALEVLGDD
jgi:hypothetical protein